jgi:hypothetical protein
MDICTGNFLQNLVSSGRHIMCCFHNSIHVMYSGFISGSCEYCNEPLGSIKGVEFMGLRNCNILKTDSATHSISLVFHQSYESMQLSDSTAARSSNMYWCYEGTSEYIMTASFHKYSISSIMVITVRTHFYQPR